MIFRNSWPRQTFPPPLLGSVAEAVGVGLMAWALCWENRAAIFGLMALTGFDDPVALKVRGLFFKLSSLFLSNIPPPPPPC